MSKKGPLVFLDVSIDGDPAERMVFELFCDVAPKTAENFRALCTGEKGISPRTGKALHYKGSFFHHIVKGLVAQGGDFLKRDGSCGESIYGEKFADEQPSKLKHDERGLLSMAVADRDTRGSLFTITFRANHHLDRKYVIFGKLVQGYDVLKKIENVDGEDGKPSVPVKIINCGELLEEKKKASKSKIGKDASSESNSHQVHRRGKHKKSSRERRKKRRRYYTSESDTSSDSDMESSDTDSDSDSDSDFDSYTSSSSSDLSSSSDDRRKKKKGASKRDRYRRGKRKDRRRERKRMKRDKKSKHRSKRASDGRPDEESETGSSDDGGTAVKAPGKSQKNQASISDGIQSPVKERAASVPQKGEATDILEREEGEYPKENGEWQSNGVEAETKSNRSPDSPDIVDDHPGKSRSRSISPKRTMSRSRSMSISPKRSLSKSQSVSRNRSVDKSPPRVSRSNSRSPVRSVSTSPVSGKMGRSISRSPVRARPGKSISRSPTASPPRTSSRKSSQKSMSRSPARTVNRSVSRSPVRSSRRSISRSPVRSSRRSMSRSSGRVLSRRSPFRSPARAPIRTNRRSYSRSPVSARQRARSPVSDRGRSISKSPSANGSPKRIRRGRGFSERYSYARRYRTPSPDRSPVRSYRYGSRNDRDRYYRRSPRRYRSPPRGRTPPRYRSRRSRSRSPASRSPIRYRGRRYSRSPIRSRSPAEASRFRDPPSQRSPSISRSSSVSRSSLDSQSPRRGSKDRSRSSSGSPTGKKGLVSYRDGSPDD
ncbi:peptidyl-prolyl cis-trans isomerase CYP95-like isoform X2 [Diospyros lotus]|uniref:peptidyl-prolyl cis-trans isomerase CYP95-like isoform X2 n=1 Tax=Diospyros lotus TaxID=55363 RepID=UPI0022524265|nr:peptidyl-prolyl cis-trans isomerase CYP95-like isoform X2 [Diospyros lotus]